MVNLLLFSPRKVGLLVQFTLI